MSEILLIRSEDQLRGPARRCAEAITESRTDQVTELMEDFFRRVGDPNYQVFGLICAMDFGVYQASKGDFRPVLVSPQNNYLNSLRKAVEELAGLLDTRFRHHLIFDFTRVGTKCQTLEETLGVYQRMRKVEVMQTLRFPHRNPA